MSFHPRAIDGLWHSLCPSFASAIRPNSFNRIITLSTKHVGRHLSSPATSSRSDEPNGNRGLEALRARMRGSDKRKLKSLDKKESADLRAKRLEEHEFQKFRWETESPELSFMSDEKLHRLLAYAKSRMWHELSDALVRRLLSERREKPDMRHYHTLLEKHTNAQMGSAAGVQFLMADMQRKGILADLHLYSTALKALAVHPDPLQQADILSEMEARWLVLTPENHAFIVAGLLRAGLLEQALDYVQELTNKGLEAAPWAYDMLIFALLNIDEVEKAARLLRQREVEKGHEEILPQCWKYLLERASYNVNYEVTLYAWRRRVELKRLVPSTGTCEAVLLTACRAGDPELATSVFGVLASRGTQFEAHHYESLIDAYAYSGDCSTALSILSVMGRMYTPTTESTRQIYKLLIESQEYVKEAWDVVQSLSSQEPKTLLQIYDTVLEAAKALELNNLEIEIEAAISVLRSKDSEEFSESLSDSCKQARTN